MGELPSDDSPVKEVSVEALDALLNRGEDLRLVDVREDDEVAGGMIPGAVHIKLGDLPDRFAELPETGEVYFICRGGGRSARACRFMAQQGRRNAVSVAGGMTAWTEQYRRG